MIVCAKCGERSSGESRFCPGCGAFLDWSGATADQPVGGAQAGTQTEARRTTAAPPLSGTVPEVVAVPATPDIPPSATPVASGRAVFPPGVPEQAVSGQAVSEQAVSERTAPPEVPRQPGAQQPTDTRPLRPSANANQRLLADDDVLCVGCRTRNPATRRICMGCGRPLDEPEEAPVRSWWRRLLPRREPAPAGHRKTRRRGRVAAVFRWLRRVFLVILAALAALYGLVPGFRASVNQEVVAGRKWVERRFGADLVPVRPTAVTANVSSPGHDALLVADNQTKTFWAAPIAGPQPTLVFTFDHPVDLRRAIIRVGDPTTFQGTHRPARLHLVYSTEESYDVPLADTPEAQTVEIAHSAGATRVELHVEDVHRSLAGTDVAIAEIELFEQP
ncbi:zinc ribbon domain-containing protein [Actinokineospora enzanensis]|uniref:zinc ribbon domain-containing protein n=1 Tax=Actinokineospora enzanensis TaxID=155975 RepID=UPI000366A09E|nr:zinc ribbon domain-containing protein [Actinokineospora enzanensis]